MRAKAADASPAVPKTIEAMALRYESIQPLAVGTIEGKKGAALAALFIGM
jgi:hypothetical protein